MTYGIQVSDASGTVIWDSSGILGRSVGIATLTTPAGSGGVGTFNVTIPGLLNSDELFINISNANNVQYTVSRSGTTVSINQTTGPFQPTNYYIWAFRVT
jgi:hypothetical protein